MLNDPSTKDTPLLKGQVCYRGILLCIYIIYVHVFIIGIIVGCEKGDNGDHHTKWTITDANNLAETFERDDYITDLDDGGRTIAVRTTHFNKTLLHLYFLGQ